MKAPAFLVANGATRGRACRARCAGEKQRSGAVLHRLRRVSASGVHCIQYGESCHLPRRRWYVQTILSSQSGAPSPVPWELPVPVHSLTQHMSKFQTNKLDGHKRILKRRTQLIRIGAPCARAQRRRTRLLLPIPPASRLPCSFR